MHTPARALPARIAVAALLLAGAAGCDVKTSDRDLILLDPPGAVDKLNARSGMFEKETVGCWVDPRSTEAYAKGHIAGAINVPLANMQESAAAKLAGHNLFVVYGEGFQDPLAKAGAKRLLEIGFKKGTVFVLEGGTRAWQKDGYTLVTGNAPAGGALPVKEEKAASTGGVEVPEKGVR